MTCSKVPEGTLPLGGWEGLDLPLPIDVEGTPPYFPSLFTCILWIMRGGVSIWLLGKIVDTDIQKHNSRPRLAPSSKTQLAAGRPILAQAGRKGARGNEGLPSVGEIYFSPPTLTREKIAVVTTHTPA